MKVTTGSASAPLTSIANSVGAMEGGALITPRYSTSPNGRPRVAVASIPPRIAPRALRPGGKAGPRHDGPEGHSRLRQDRGLDEDDVAHGQECDHARAQFGADRRSVLPQPEQPLQQSPGSLGLVCPS